VREGCFSFGRQLSGDSPAGSLVLERVRRGFVHGGARCSSGLMSWARMGWGNQMRVIGVDCATNHSDVGVALGEYEAGAVCVSKVEVCSRQRSAVAIVAEWLDGEVPALLAIDAPLGWPAAFARALVDHHAGDDLAVAPSDMFRRETDRFLRREIGKTPLDVGADRIARTAHAALAMLARLRDVTGAAIPLAWSHDTPTGIAAVEVYPAATLHVHGLRSTGYKKPQQVNERGEIVAALAGVLTLPADTSPLTRNADALDAVVCLLAAKDFLDGRAMEPVDADLAHQEGWIWTAPLGLPREHAVAPTANERLTIPAAAGDRASERHAGDVITDVGNLTWRDAAGRRVLCPACRGKEFRSWPAGWDAHAAHNCPGVNGTNDGARKADFKGRFGHLFR
jgi:predicted RNase H-like nuclease